MVEVAQADAPAAFAAAGAPPALPLLSVVVPVHDEQDGIAEFDRRLQAVLATLPARSEIVYVNDGSRDHSLELLLGLRAAHRNVAVLDLSRNFGKEIALSAGLDAAAGDAVVVIDADLQDPPELIPDLFAKWREGFDNVYAQRTQRDGETLFKRTSAAAFYRFLNAISDHAIPVDTGDFRLLSRRAVDALMQLRERHRFMKGLFSWIGYAQVAVPYRREGRHAGTTSWNYWKLWNFSIEGLTSFSTVPLKIASYVGFVAAVLAVFYGSLFLVKTLFFGNPVAGYPSLLVIMLFLGGVQLLSLGIIGEYLGRLFNEAKGRPLYFVKTFAPSQDAAARPPRP